MLGILSIVGTGCEERLDIPKHGNLGGQEDFYKTDDDALQALASLYNTWGGNYYNWFYVKNLLADDVWCGGGSRGDNASMEQLNEYTFDTDHGMVQYQMYIHSVAVWLYISQSYAQKGIYQ